MDYLVNGVVVEQNEKKETADVLKAYQERLIKKNENQEEKDV